MLPDFATAFHEFISDDGTMRPPFAMPVPSTVIWGVDPDGLLMTTPQTSHDGTACLLSVLFPMPLGAARAKHRQQRFPAKPGDYMMVVRKHDEVVGAGGERYSRFIAEVTATG